MNFKPGPMKAEIPRSRISVILAIASHLALLAFQKKESFDDILNLSN